MDLSATSWTRPDQDWEWTGTEAGTGLEWDLSAAGRVITILDVVGAFFRFD